MIKKLKLILYILFGLFFTNIALAEHIAATVTKNADVKLYALNCGLINIHDGAAFSDTEFYPHKPINLVDTCFLIKHDNDWLLWDLGLGDQYVGKKNENKEHGVDWSVPVSLVSQLKQIGLTPNDIKYVGLSHTHFDHTGNANLFLKSTWLIQKAEYKSLEQSAVPAGVNTSLFKLLSPVTKILITGDHDVFGDGSLIILSTPGHTVGHQSLRVKLPHTGVVILSGDLYHNRMAYRYKQNPINNVSRADNLASMSRIDGVLRNTHGRLIIQHDPNDFAALPKFPQFLN